MAGYPDRAASLGALHAVADAGADVIELGVPYSDQLADGPVIVQASAEARAGGRRSLRPRRDPRPRSRVRRRRRRCGQAMPPIALMTYLNPVMRFGFAEAAEAMAAAGVVGRDRARTCPPDNPMAAGWLAGVASLAGSTRSSSWPPLRLLIG